MSEGMKSNYFVELQDHFENKKHFFKKLLRDEKQNLYLDIHSRLFILILSGKTISSMCCEVNSFILILSLLFPSVLTFNLVLFFSHTLENHMVLFMEQNCQLCYIVSTFSSSKYERNEGSRKENHQLLLITFSYLTILL